jgi:hypothetical protein
VLSASVLTCILLAIFLLEYYPILSLLCYLGILHLCIALGHHFGIVVYSMIIDLQAGSTSPDLQDPSLYFSVDDVKEHIEFITDLANAGLLFFYKVFLIHDMMYSLKVSQIKCLSLTSVVLGNFTGHPLYVSNIFIEDHFDNM